MAVHKAEIRFCEKIGFLYHKGRNTLFSKKGISIIFNYGVLRMNKTSPPIIQLEGIEKCYPCPEKGQKIKVLNDIDLSVHQGQFVAIRGESGSGKTTLLRILGLMDKNYDGNYILSGHTIQENKNSLPGCVQEEIRADHIGFIFQEDRLLEYLSAEANIELPLAIHRSSKEKYHHLKELTHEVYTQKEESDKLLKRKKGLSGGQRQRASILRALAKSPQFILADEPTANLEPTRTKQILQLMKKLCQAGHTIIVVSHDSIFEKADVVYELKNGNLIRQPKSTMPEKTDVVDVDNLTHNIKQVEIPTRTKLWGGLKPKTPLTLQFGIATKDLFRNIIFTLLIVGALILGSFQATVFLSLHAGTNVLIDDKIREGSKLTRIRITTKDLTQSERFPDMAEIQGIKGVLEVVPRREGIYRIRDKRGRDRYETLFGLENNDPEYQQLVFTAGGEIPFDNALEVIMSERSIKRLFNVPENKVTDEFRSSLIGKYLRFSIARTRDPNMRVESFLGDDVPMEVFKFSLKLVGIVAQAESERNFYFPKHTQLVLERWRLDEQRQFKIPLFKNKRVWTVNENALHKLVEYPWAESAHVYLKTIDDVIPAYTELTTMGYEPYAEIFNFQWLIDTRHLAQYVLMGLVGLAAMIGGLIIINNILTSIKIRQKEIILFKLLGMRDGDVTAIYLWNTIMATIIGTLLGFLLGTLVVSGLAGWAATYYGNTDFARIFAPTTPFFWWIMLGGVVLAILSAIIPAYKAGRLDPIKGFEQ